jgi:hypothetical protein
MWLTPTLVALIDLDAVRLDPAYRRGSTPFFPSDSNFTMALGIAQYAISQSLPAYTGPLAAIRGPPPRGRKAYPMAGRDVLSDVRMSGAGQA